MCAFTRRLTVTLIERILVVAIIGILAGTLRSAQVYGDESGCKEPQTVVTLGDSIAVSCAENPKGADSEVKTDATASPLPFAHAHNDYVHKRPLLDALDNGFCSIEADIWLVDGQLLVAHDRKRVRKDRTLQALYLDPLLKRVKANGGSVYVKGPSVTLLIDIKSDPETTYRALVDALKPYNQMLTTFHKDKTETKAVTVIISGWTRPYKLMKSEQVRIAGYEGRVSDLGKSESPHFMPLISDAWKTHFKWNGRGPMPDEERKKLKAIVAKSHKQGKRIRFWAIPNTPAVWSELLEAGVDLINVDDLAKFKEFYLANREASPNLKPKDTVAPSQ